MLENVVLPPDDQPTGEGIRAGGWWHSIGEDQRIACDLCPRGCVLKPGARGFCFVRQNLAGRMVSTTYGRSTGFCIDPIEKKPLNQFYPGTAVLSFGTAGCNLGCKFCQNWSISKSREIDSLGSFAEPEAIARSAKEFACRSVAFTYNDPIVWAEYAIETAKACRAQGIKTVAVTSGYMSPAARGPFYAAMDAANVDLKAFTEDFYWKLTSGHLEPVLDTLRWLVHESDVWVEITNLMIPRANDSDDEIRGMCDWILTELGSSVPLHFTAFHPDFRLGDRGPTPPETLARAYEIARRAGLQYVYTGNISDRPHQSTFCPGCGRAVIERDGYELGVYALEDDCCRHCRTPIAGRFDKAPGNWGAKRLPVRIAPLPTKSSPLQSRPAEAPKKTSRRPELTPEQEALVLRAAGRRVVAAVRSTPAERLDEVLGEVSGMPLLGAFVSLKRAGQLRSCCGFLGQSVPLYQALDHAAVRAAKDDPRFPPISPAELDHLDMDVWLLWDLEPVLARGLDRVKAIVIGKHGLQISRGNARGLLLPGVAIEHHLDAEGFLRQVCLKAGLPPGAWMEDSTTLMTFEGFSLESPLRAVAGPGPEPAAYGPTQADLAMLADFCRGNVVALVHGATPSFYLPGGFDGGVNGAVLCVEIPGRPGKIECCKFSLRPDIPLQSTLYELAQTMAQNLRSVPLDPQSLSTIRCGLSIFWDTAMHGHLERPDLADLQPRRRAVFVADQAHWALAFDPRQSADDLLAEAVQRGRMTGSAQAQVYSLAGISSEPSLSIGNAEPQAVPAVRPPAVAGRFYPDDPAELAKMLDQLLPVQGKPEPWAGAMVPHAGWIYSGHLAAEALSRLKFPSRAIIICPKHHAAGANWAVAPHRVWSLPGQEVQSDSELAQRLSEAVSGLVLDAEAHRAEHAIEVQLPLVARLAPQTRVVGIAIHGGDLASLGRFAEQMAGVLAEMPERPLLIISSDMNHYASDARTRHLDRLALDAMESLDPARLYRTVTENQISMCGLLPAVLVMETLRRLGSLNRCQPAGYATSAETSGDRQRVVGYAGMLFA